MTARRVKAIPTAAAKRIAQAYGYDQVIVLGRRMDAVGLDGEHLTVFGRSGADAAEAERLGRMLRARVMSAS